VSKGQQVDQISPDFFDSAERRYGFASNTRFDLPSHGVDVSKYFLSAEADGNIVLHSGVEGIPGGCNRGPLLSRPWRTFHVCQVPRIALAQGSLFSLVGDNTNIEVSTRTCLKAPRSLSD
jgi:hypothetical protein